ncbi:retrovirus-related pol polyprotein from transposon TNT 1-94 [Tanacetum coccineum]
MSPKCTTKINGTGSKDLSTDNAGLRKYISQWRSLQAVAATEGNPAIQQHTTIETILNMTPENKKHFLSEKEAIFLLLTGIGDDIYSTVDACKTANEMWITIERLQQGESLNIQDVKTNLSNATSSSTRHSESTRHKGKEIAKLVTPQSESVSEEDSDPEQAQRDTDMQKNLALLAKYFKRLYKPTNNNLRTSSNSRNKTEDTTPRYNNENQSGQFGNQRTITVAGARETVGNQVVQQTGIQCFNCKGYGHYAKECRKPKRVKDYAYHKEKMMMCKQAEQGVPLQAEQADWLEDTDEEIDEQELEAHYSFMLRLRQVSPEESSLQEAIGTGTKSDEIRMNSNVTPDSSNICTNDNQVDQNAAECVDERVALANLIANLTLDTEENKTILKQLKKANASLTQELEKCKTNLDETNSALGEAISV